MTKRTTEVAVSESDDDRAAAVIRRVLYPYSPRERSGSVSTDRAIIEALRADGAEIVWPVPDRRPPWMRRAHHALEVLSSGGVSLLTRRKGVDTTTDR